MNKTLLLNCLVAGIGVFADTAATAQTTLTGFTGGNVVVYRVGDGSAALGSTGTAVFLDEYSLTGTLLGSYALPTTGTPLVASGSATSEGELTTSANGRYLLVTGYDAPLATAGVASTAAAAVPREVATVSASLGLTQTTLNAYSGNNIRGAASVDGTTIYTSGATTGILAVSSGATAAAGTVVSSTSVNNRAVGIYGGQLFFSTGTGATFRLLTTGAASAAAGQTATEVPGITTTNVTSPYNFVATTLAGGGTLDTIYLADNSTGTIDKFSLVGGSFTLTGTATLSGVLGLTGITVGSSETLVATTAGGIYLLSDATGAGGMLTGTPTQIATAAANEAFRGVAFAPGAVPEPSVYALLLAGGLGVWVAARRRARRSAA